MSKFILPLVAFLALAGIFAAGLRMDPSRIPSPLLEHQGPQFELPSVQDPKIKVGSANYAGEMVLVNIWATWCPGCRQEHGFLLELAQEGTIPIFGLNWRDNRADAMQWLQGLGNPYMATAFDADGHVGIDWGAYGAPETFLLDANGVVVYKHIAPLNRAIWEREFVPLINGLEQSQ